MGSSYYKIFLVFHNLRIFVKFYEFLRIMRGGFKERMVLELGRAQYIPENSIIDCLSIK